MKAKLTIIIVALGLCSCGIPLPDGGQLKTTVGWYAPALPGNPAAKFGGFTERVAPPVVEPEK